MTEQKRYEVRESNPSLVGAQRSQWIHDAELDRALSLQEQCDALNRLHAAETELAAVKAERDILLECEGICRTFVDRVQRGEVHSRRTYTAMLLALAGVDQLRRDPADPTPAPDCSDPADASGAAACGACDGTGMEPPPTRICGRVCDICHGTGTVCGGTGGAG